MNNDFIDITPEVLKLQMKKILQSDKFLSSRHFTNFLEYVVNQTLSGKEDKVKEYNIGVEVFDRGKNFVPQLDPIVRIYAGRLRQALNDYYYSEGKNDNVKIEIPKGTYVPVFSKMDLTINKISNESKPKSLFQKFNKPYLKGSVFVIIGVIVFAYFFDISHKNDFQKDILGRTSIEIKPFQNLNDNSESNNLILRLIDQTEIALGQFTSILICTDSDIGDFKSNPYYTMTGSMQQDKDIIKIRVKLVDNQSGVQVFSKEYIESINTNAAIYIEEVFANKIAIDLADEFGELQKFRLRNAQDNDSELLPHEAVLLYYDYLTHMNKSDNKKVLLELQKTVTYAKEYEPAWAAIAGLYLDKYRHFDGDLQDVEFAREAIKKAEIINPRSVHVQNHLAQIALTEKKLDDFYESIEKQMTLNPNSTLMGEVGLWLCLIGDYTRGIPLIESAKERNPYCPGYIYFGNYFYFLEKDQLNKAYSEVEKVNMPLLFWDPLLRASTLGHLDRKEEGRLALKELLNLKPNFSEDGNELMRRSLYSEKNQELIVQGLSKIDFKLADID